VRTSVVQISRFTHTRLVLVCLVSWKAGVWIWSGYVIKMIKFGINLVSIFFFFFKLIPADINLSPDMFSWQLEKLQTLNNASQWINKDKQVQTILVRLSFIPSSPTHNEDGWGVIAAAHKLGQVILWKHRSQLIFLQKQQETLFKSAQPFSVHSIF